MRKIIFPEKAKFEHEELRKWFLDITDAVNEMASMYDAGYAHAMADNLDAKQTQEPEMKEPIICSVCKIPFNQHPSWVCANRKEPEWPVSIDRDGKLKVKEMTKDELAERLNKYANENDIEAPWGEIESIARKWAVESVEKYWEDMGYTYEERLIERLKGGRG